ncbi:MAG: acyltransferase [Desulfobacterales bacterium]|nr:acyltransferase [Desulfobacterales bacterium]MCP4163554.1 acyltransferase [Deltaproteobacteria bacterium]
MRILIRNTTGIFFHFLVKTIVPVYEKIAKNIHRAALISKIQGFDFSVQADGKAYVKGNISIGSKSRIGRDVELQTEDRGSINIGQDVRINTGCTIVSYRKIHIGDHTLIGEYVSIRDANHGTACGNIIKTQLHTSKPVNIGKDVWIGRGSCILPGVTIGDGAVIGANSVVTKDITSYSVSVGNPAVKIRERI